MVTERIVLAIAGALAGRIAVMRDAPGSVDANSPNVPGATESRHENALPVAALHEALLTSYTIDDIQSALTWMKLRGYVGSFGVGHIEMGLNLTDKGIALAKSRTLPAEDLQRLSARAVTVKPAIYGVALDLKELWWRVKKLFRRHGA